MRNVLKKCYRTLMVLVCAAIAMPMFATPEPASVNANKTIGIQLYSVMGAMMKNPQASIERLAGMGYNACELVQWGGNPKVFGLDAKDFKALCDKNGIDIISTHSSVQEDPTKEAEIMNQWRSLFEVQKACGGKYFVIPSYKFEYTVSDVKKMCDYFNRVGKIASEYGLKLGYHNHSDEFKTLEGTDQVMWEYLVENTDPQYVFVELDVYWCTKGGKNPVEYLKKYPNRIEMLHIKDEFVIGESGTIDFENIFKQFYANGKKDYVVEIEIPKSLSENKKHADGTKFNYQEIMMDEQILEEMFKAADKSAKYLQSASFVK